MPYPRDNKDNHLRMEPLNNLESGFKKWSFGEQIHWFRRGKTAAVAYVHTIYVIDRSRKYHNIP